MRSDQMLLKTGVSHTARVDLLSYMDPEPIQRYWGNIDIIIYYKRTKQIKNNNNNSSND